MFLIAVHQIYHYVNVLMLHVTTYRVSSIYKLARFAELNHAFLEIVEGTLDQNSLLFVMIQQVVPQRLLREHFGISNNDDTIPKTNVINIIYFCHICISIATIEITQSITDVTANTAHIPSSGKSHIETTWVVQESDALMFIGTDTREHYEVFLTALERINTGNLYVLQTPTHGYETIILDANNYTKKHITKKRNHAF